MKAFKTKSFARFARKSGLSDVELRKAVNDLAAGLVGADLGGGVVKQRIARRGGGKSGGYRAIVVFRMNDRAIFVHGFAKNEIDNIRDDELAMFKKLAAELLSFDTGSISRAVASGVLIEVSE